MSKPRIVLLPAKPLTDRLFTPEALAHLAELGELVVNPGRDRPALEETMALLRGARACVTSWGCQPMAEEVLGAAPDLGLIVHAAGSVKPIVTEAVWARGITVTSGAAAIAVNVAEMTIACLILGLRRVWELAEVVRSGGWSEERQLARSYTLNQATIGVVGASHVGRRVVELLRVLAPKEVLLYDPHWSVEDVAALGAVQVSLSELLRRSDAVTLHAPALPATRHMLGAPELALMKDDAVLINTSRGQNIAEGALVAELEKGRLLAFLDVTDPEPPAADSRLRFLRNVVLTPHVAGGGPNPRLGNLAAEEVGRFLSGLPPLHGVTRDLLDRIA